MCFLEIHFGINLSWKIPPGKQLPIFLFINCATLFCSVSWLDNSEIQRVSILLVCLILATSNEPILPTEMCENM